MSFEARSIAIQHRHTWKVGETSRLAFRPVGSQAVALGWGAPRHRGVRRI